MPGKIFVNYRRDDDPAFAARIRDGLAQRFGKTNLFMDVDNLLAGRRFDEELAKALSTCDVLIAVMGADWVELLNAKISAGERDYVVEEIGGALQRRIPVIPVRVGREGKLAPLPRTEELPDSIRDLVHYQKHDVVHENFGQNIAALRTAIATLRKSRGGGIPRIAGAAAVAVVLMAVYAGAGLSGLPVPWPFAAPVEPVSADAAARAKAATELKARADEVERLRVAAAKAEEDRKTAQAEAAKLRADTEARRKADEEARVKAAAETEAKRKADDAERLRLASLQKAEEDRKRAEAETARQPRPSGVPGLVIVEGFAPKPGQTFRDCNDGCPEMVVVPAGSFSMGSPSSEERYSGYDGREEPQRTVTIRQSFAVGKLEVTFAEWEACVSGGGCPSNRSPSDAGWGKGRRPVIDVSWNDAKEYVAWLSRKTGKTYRLLSEAEWEYAARAGTTTPFSTGRTITTAQSNFNGNYTYGGSAKGQDRQRTIEVGSFPANQFGLHDMHGNVWEWCEDTWHSNYQGAPTDGSAWTTGGTSSRVLRGGSWFFFHDILRSANRVSGSPGNRNSHIGFRVARTL